MMWPLSTHFCPTRWTWTERRILQALLPNLPGLIHVLWGLVMPSTSWTAVIMATNKLFADFRRPAVFVYVIASNCCSNSEFKSFHFIRTLTNELQSLAIHSNVCHFVHSNSNDHKLMNLPDILGDAFLGRIQYCLSAILKKLLADLPKSFACF